MALLSKLSILSATKLPTRDIEVPEWGGTVRIRTLSGAELEDYQNDIMESRKGKKRIDLRGSTAKLLVRVIVGESGEPEFSEGDIASLSALSARALQRVQDAALEMNGLKESDLDEMVKN